MSPTLTWHEVASTRWGRFKLWLLYGPPRRLDRLIPVKYRWSVIKAARRWVFGPNANLEDLMALLERAASTARGA